MDGGMTRWANLFPNDDKVVSQAKFLRVFND